MGTDLQRQSRTLLTLPPQPLPQLPQELPPWNHNIANSTPLVLQHYKHYVNSVLTEQTNEHIPIHTMNLFTEPQTHNTSK